MQDDQISGEIRPNPDGGAPIFRVIKRGPRVEFDGVDEPGVRPCEHGQFILDERWGTVTCGRCKCQVSPFHALLSFADWYERLEQRRWVAEDAERRLHVSALRGLVQRRALTDAERTEITAVLAQPHRTTTADLAKLVTATERTLRQRRHANRTPAHAR